MKKIDTHQMRISNLSTKKKKQTIHQKGGILVLGTKLDKIMERERHRERERERETRSI